MKPEDAKATEGAPDGALPPQSTGDEGYRVSLPMFEGPLDLLLHLVKKHELDVLNIPIAFITEKYVAYIQLLDQLNIDVASEYLLMAATLVHLKSRMLLPNPPAEDLEDGQDDSDMDPRAELVRRLLEYQKYKLAAEELSARNLLGRDIFPRGSSDEAANGQPPLESVSMFKLLDAFQSVLERTHKTRDHEISFDRFSITERISELADLLQDKKKLVFHQLFAEGSGRAELIMTFLALLEMTRLRMIRLTQDGPLAPIYIELRVADDSDAAYADPVYADSTEDDSAEDDSAEDDSTEDDSAEDDSAEDDSAEDDSADSNPVGRDSVEADSAEMDPADTDLADTGPVDAGPVDDADDARASGDYQEYE
jgi:segregation and condensation protein A